MKQFLLFLALCCSAVSFGANASTGLVELKNIKAVRCAYNVLKLFGGAVLLIIAKFENDDNIRKKATHFPHEPFNGLSDLSISTLCGMGTILIGESGKALWEEIEKMLKKSDRSENNVMSIQSPSNSTRRR